MRVLRETPAKPARFQRASRFAFFVLMGNALLAASPTVQSQTASTVTRDAHALTVAGQSLIVMGGTTPPDSVATGTFTLQSGGTVDVQPFKVTTRGLHEYREERITSRGPISVTYSHGRAFTTLAGERKALSGRTAINDYCPYFPLAGILGDIADNDVAAEFIGSETDAGRTLYHVKLHNSFASLPGMAELNLGDLTQADLWVDATTLLPVRLTYSLYAINAPNESIPVEIRFDSFQNFAGVLFPTRLTKYMNGTLFADIEFTQVQFDVGVTDADLGLN